MKSAPFPGNEAERLAALMSLDILDSSPEIEFEALVRIASLVCGTPISLISLVDTERQWFKANIGLPGVSETPRDVAFCSHAILDDTLFEIPDALQDQRFADNPLVIGAPDIRFYAGSPINLGDGYRVGTLCVIDREPRQLTDQQREIMNCLALAAGATLEGRRAVRGHRNLTMSLLDSEEHLRKLYQSTPALMLSIDKTGRVLTASDLLLSKLGYRHDQVVGHLFSALMTPQSQQSFKSVLALKMTQQDGCSAIPLELWAKDGAIFNVLFSSIPDTSGNQTISQSLAVMEDVTDRLAAEKKLEMKRQRLAHIVSSTHSGTWEWNIQTGEVIFNERWAEIISYTVSELQPVSVQTWLDHTHPDDLNNARQLLEQHCADITVPYEYEMRMRHKNGDLVWILARGRVLTWTQDGKPEWMYGTHEDVTPRINRQLELEKLKERLTIATESGEIGIWEWDLVTGLLECDAIVYRLFGLSKPEHLEAIDAWLPRVHDGDRIRVGEELQLAASGSSPFDSEFRIQWNDGSVHHLKATAKATGDVKGHPATLVGACWDITASKALTEKLAEQQELLAVTLRSIGDAVITTDASCNVAWLNPVAERMTGWLTTEAIGRPLGQVFHIVNEETRKPTENPAMVCLEQGKIVGLANHTVLISRNGEEYGIEDSAAPIRNEKHELLGVVLVFHDVTEQRRLSGEMSYRATHDNLTGLVNRAEFETRLRRVLRKAHEEGSEHYLLYIDLDQFKLVNDSCGHAVGDELLQQVSKLLTASIRDRDTLARLGGDEFAIILEHCTPVPGQRVAQQICERMDDFRFVHEGRRFRIGTSIGLVPVDKRWATTEAIMQAADTSCYAAKEAGRNRVHAWFDSDLAMRTRHGEMQWTDRIGQALDEDLFVLHAQRITPMKYEADGIHAEILVRMIEKDGSLIAPGAFFPAAERFHLANRIDRWVLRNTIEWMQNLPSLDVLSLISINLSGQSIGDRAFHRWALDLLHAAGPEICHKVCIEITETAVITNLSDASLFIEQIHAAGMQVALDDFGAGASSFGYLKSLQVDYLKIDGQFVRNLTTGSLDEATVRCFTDVAKVVGVKTVAEFVENQEVMALLREMGVDYVQGFLLHRPETIDNLIGNLDLITDALTL